MRSIYSWQEVMTLRLKSVVNWNFEPGKMRSKCNALEACTLQSLVKNADLHSGYVQKIAVGSADYDVLGPDEWHNRCG